MRAQASGEIGENFLLAKISVQYYNISSTMMGKSHVCRPITMTLDEQMKQQKLMEEENKRKKTLIEQALNDRLFLWTNFKEFFY